MALIDKASLLMVPSTYEDGTLYNVLPSGNKAPDETGSHNGYDQTRADFTFSRGSNLAATRRNSSGLIEKGRENLLTYSRTFTSDWLSTNATITSGQSGYDGSNNAVKVTADADGAISFQQGISFSNVNTFSVYLKAGNIDFAKIFMVHSGANRTAVINLVNGTIEQDNNADIPATITSISNGWYRCTISANSTSGSIVRVRSQRIEGDDNVLAGDFIYIQDAQLEKGLVATDYIETGATTATAGVLENTPRIDYSSGAGALLLEPQRTNLITQSEYFGAWNGFRTDLSANSTTSPEGISNAYSMVPNTDNNTHFIYFNTSESAVDYSFSLFAKSNGQQWIQLAKGGGGYANFDLTNGVKGNYGTDGSSAFTDSKIEDFGNGWYRITAYYTSVGGASNIGIAAISSDVTARYQSFAGDGTSGYYIYGAQLESSASYESSYVPTYGSAATRGADSCSVTGVSDVIGQSEGTIYAEVDWDGRDDDSMFFTLSDGTTNNRMHIGYDENQNRFYFNIRVGNVQQALIVQNTPTIGIKKIAAAYKANDVALYINGSQIGTSTSTSIAATTRIDLGNYYSSGFEYPVIEAVLFNERLTNSELATLTTL